MRILLVRHGESLANVDKQILRDRPDHDIGLSDKGVEQATACGETLRKYANINMRELIANPTSGRWRIWHSPYKRTTQTADLIRNGMLPYVLDMREHILLGEQQFGLFDGVPDDELPIRFPAEHAFYKKHEDFEGRFWARMPLGESRFDVAQRVHQSFGTFHRDAERHGVENLIVVCHGVVVRAFVMMWCHKTVKWFENERNPGNCSIRVIEGKEDCGYLEMPK
jgi:broad specificity phosphatase PhoE